MGSLDRDQRWTQKKFQSGVLGHFLALDPKIRRQRGNIVIFSLLRRSTETHAQPSLLLAKAIRSIVEKSIYFRLFQRSIGGARLFDNTSKSLSCLSQVEPNTLVA